MVLSSAVRLLTMHAEPRPRSRPTAAPVRKHRGVDLALEPLRQFCGEANHRAQWPVIQANALDQACGISRDDRRACDGRTEGLSLPFQVRLTARDGLVREIQVVVHLRRRGEEGADLVNADARSVHHGGIERYVWLEGGREFRRAVL